jgi:hypothetical protein
MSITTNNRNATSMATVSSMDAVRRTGRMEGSPVRADRVYNARSDAQQLCQEVAIRSGVPLSRLLSVDGREGG